MRFLLQLAVGLLLIDVARCCPGGCSCDSSRKEVVCSGLTSLPTSFPAGTLKLVVTNSDIPALNPVNMAPLKAAKITILSLERCNIGSLSPMVFYPFPELRELNLAHNNLTRIDVTHMLGLSGIVRLNLNDNSIRDVLSGAFATMDQLIELNLSRNQLSFFPTHLFVPLESLRHMDISYNKFSSFPALTFMGLRKLQHLNAESNQLIETSSDSFSGLVGLQELNLNGNKLYGFPPNVFLPLTALKTLSLEKNRLLPKYRGQFANYGLFGLKELRLGENNIFRLSIETFYNMTKLQHLDISKNKLTTVPNLTFNGLPNLLMLNLSHNNLNYVPKKAFQSLVNLSVLDMGYNGLKDLNGVELDSLSALDTLILKNNELGEMPTNVHPSVKNLDLRQNKIRSYGNSSNSLSGLITLDLGNNLLDSFISDFNLRNLKTLKMDQNQINKLELHHLKPMPMLRVLDLSDNFIQTVHVSLKPNFDLLEFLSLKNNPFHCNCEVLWLKNVTAKTLVYPACNLGALQQPMQSTQESQFTCSGPKFVLDSSFVYSDGGGTHIKCHATGDPAPTVEWHMFSISHDPSTHYECKGCYKGYRGAFNHRCYCTTGTGTSVPQIIFGGKVHQKQPEDDKTIVETRDTLHVSLAKSATGYGYQCTASNIVGRKRLYFAVEDLGLN